MAAPTEPGRFKADRRLDLRRLARWLTREKVGADQIAVIGFASALLAAAALALSGVSIDGWRTGLLLLAAVALALRLLSVRIEALVTAEEGRVEPAHPIWSALFDRVADTALLAATGFAAVIASLNFGPLLGWTCAVLGLLAAYLGERGRGTVSPAADMPALYSFAPLLLLEAGVVVSILEPLWRGKGQVLLLGLTVVALWSLVRVVRLAGRLDREALAKGPADALADPGA